MTRTTLHTSSHRTVATALTGIALALAAACGTSSSGSQLAGGSPSASTRTQVHNAADVAFASDMIPHHAQAVEMADLALATATDAQVRSLATAIKGAQDPEIATMTGWLKEWGSPVPATGSAHMGGSGHGGMTMTGMMSEDEMASLEHATGADFDRMWVEMMTRHHEGAVAMARTEVGSGQSGDAKALAQRIITGQSAEIATMASIAKRLG